MSRFDDNFNSKNPTTTEYGTGILEEVLYKSNLHEERLASTTHVSTVFNPDVSEEVLFKSDLKEVKLSSDVHTPVKEEVALEEQAQEPIVQEESAQEPIIEEIAEAVVEEATYEESSLGVDEEVLYRSDLKEEKLDGLNNSLDVNEEVLYKTYLHEEKLGNKAHASSNGNNDLSEEVLYKTYLREEKLTSKTHTLLNDNLDVREEVLYKSGYESINVKENAVLKEEQLEFKHPVIPSYVTEEVLFDENGKRLSFSNPENDSETAITEDVLDSGDFASDDAQLSFDDIDVNVNLDENSDDFDVEKIVYKKKSFAEKMFDCDPIILERYDELKNLLLVYKKVKSRISNTCDTFKLGSMRLAKISTSGKSLKLYLNLDMNEVESRLKCKEAGHKKAYEETPVFLRIRSPRSMRNAKYLINQLATKFGLVENPKFEIVNSVELLKEKLN